METKTIKIDGMSCGHCVQGVKNALSELDLEVIEVEIGSAKVKFDSAKVSENKIAEAIDDAGFEVV
ncbi:MAG: copper chaperone [Calditrichaeota bacterium]|nr:MAG: copper chaperone [Calditrichota bacterium]